MFNINNCLTVFKNNRNVQNPRIAGNKEFRSFHNPKPKFPLTQIQSKKGLGYRDPIEDYESYWLDLYQIVAIIWLISEINLPNYSKSLPYPIRYPGQCSTIFGNFHRLPRFEHHHREIIKY